MSFKPQARRSRGGLGVGAGEGLAVVKLQAHKSRAGLGIGAEEGLRYPSRKPAVAEGRRSAGHRGGGGSRSRGVNPSRAGCWLGVSAFGAGDLWAAGERRARPSGVNPRESGGGTEGSLTG